MKGYELAAEPGAPVWHELHTKDYDKAVKFYQDVFGWDTAVLSDTPEFRYTTLGAGDAAKAGILDASGFLPEGVPSTGSSTSAWRTPTPRSPRPLSWAAALSGRPKTPPMAGMPPLPTRQAPFS